MLYENLREVYQATLMVRELQPNSIQTYMTIYDSFIRYAVHLNKNPEDVLREEIIFYLSKIKSEATRRQAKGMLTNLYSFVFCQGFKLMGIPNPKQHNHTPDYISTFDLTRLFDSIKNIKQRTILKFEYACALRVNEVCNVKKTDFIKKWDSNTLKYVYDLRIKGKGGNTDIVSVPEETIKEISDYYKTLSEKEKDTDYLFRGQFRCGYSPRTVQIIMGRAMRMCGIPKPPNKCTHLLRTSRATHFLLAGIDISLVQKLLRHRSIKTTQQFYNGITTTDLRVIFSRADKFLQDSLQSEINQNHQKQLLASA